VFVSESVVGSIYITDSSGRLVEPYTMKAALEYPQYPYFSLPCVRVNATLLTELSLGFAMKETKETGPHVNSHMLDTLVPTSRNKFTCLAGLVLPKIATAE
jgi:hypothetical protein